MKRNYKWLILLAGALIVISILLWLFFGKSDQPLEIYDSKGNLLLSTSSETDILNHENRSYFELVLNEATDILVTERNLSRQQAIKALLTDGFRIHTAFDPIAQAALLDTAKNWEDQLDLCGAIIDLQGNVVAAYGGTDISNSVLSRHSPHSSFKPLSVYGPALEKGILNWSSVMTDSPYSQITWEDGSIRDWPTNDSGQYSQEPITVERGIQVSLNTVAVKWLNRLGVSESIAFMQEKLGIPLVQEAYAANRYGENEVIGSIALGSLEHGVTVTDMAGYYQIFATGGTYIAPSALITLQCKEQVYHIKRNSVQVLSPGNADIMNKLLQQVVASGTGVKAFCENVETAGKTGTGVGHTDNWFVGITPGYSCALWHGHNEINTASAIFSQVITKLYDTLEYANTRFITHENLTQKSFCCESGLAATPNCKNVNTGYYTQSDSLNPCNIHN